MPTLWTNPTPGPGPAELQSKFQLNPGHPHYPQALPPNLAQQIGPILHELGQAMEKRRNDGIQQKLLEQQDPQAAATYAKSGLTGQAAMQQYQWDQQGSQQSDTQDLNQQIQQAKLAKMQAELDAPASNDHRRYSATLPSGEVIDDLTGDKKLDYEMRDNPDLHLRGGASDPWSKAIPLARGKLDSATGKFTNQYTGAENGDYINLSTPTGKNVAVPYVNYAKHIPATQAQYQIGDNSEPPADSPDTVPQQTPPPPAAIAHLQANPQLAGQFDAKYGPGASAQYLGQ